MKSISVLLFIIFLFVIIPESLKSQSPNEIIFQTEGSSFSPLIQLKGAATVLWTFADGSTSNSLNPEINYGTSATRLNYLSVDPWSALKMINIGYDAGDGGSSAITYVGDQHVSKVQNLDLVQDYLEIWCSSYNNLDTLIFDDFVLLDSIECYLSQTVQYVSLKNTPSLTRLCLEDNNLSALDISQCTQLADLRGASNNYSTINFSDSSEEIWHICVRDNPQITNDTLFTQMERFPNISELFIWNDNQGGTFRLKPENTSPYISLLAAWNNYSSLILKGSLQNESGGAMIEFSGNDIQSIDLEGCDQITTLLLNNNGISSDTIDKILYQLDQMGTTNRRAELMGNWPPTSSGQLNKANLESKGWTILTEAACEMDMVGNGNIIIDGDETPSVDDSTDFGSVNIGQGGITRRFIIQNNGSNDLTLEGSVPYVTLSGTGSSNFTVLNELDSLIAAGSSDTLLIHFDATMNGTYNASLSIVNNDWNENPYNFSVRAVATVANPDTIIDYGQITNEILFQTESDSFAPVISLSAPATVLWTFADGTSTNAVAPVKSYPSDATRWNKLKVTPWSALRTINIGYDAGDGGLWSMTHVPDQHVSKVKNIDLVKDNLEVWCSSYNQLDTLIFDDFILLDSIECYLSQSIQYVSLKNTPLLTRLCLEDNNLATLDLSGCTGLADLRGALNNYSTIDFSNSTEEIWHICVRDNPQITNDTIFAHMEMFPNIAELFIWNDNQGGTFKMKQNNSSRAISIQANGNHYTSLDLKGSLQNESGTAEVVFGWNNLKSVDLEGCDQIMNLSLPGNDLSSDSVDKVLRQLDEFGTSNGVVNLQGNGIPSVTGMAHKANLESRGWTVDIQYSAEISVLGNGVSIADNDNYPSVIDSTDFGFIYIADTITKSFIIQNTGNIALNANGSAPYISLSGTDAGFFSIVGDVDFPIPARSSDTLTIAFFPAAKRIYNVEIYINTDDGDENPFNFTIRGTGNINNSDLISTYDTISSEILFLTQGSSFTPLISLNQEASVVWTFADGTTSSSLNPLKDYGTDSARMNRLKVTPWEAVRMINIGYDGGDGGWSLPYVANQHVSYLKNLNLVKDSLKYWCSSYNLLDSLILDDFTNLEEVECYLSSTMTRVSLENMPKLRRICFEDNNLSSFDISGCPALEDIRGALNNYSTISFSNSTEEFWHICVRDNPQVTNDSLFAHMENFPNISELFIWNMNQSGKFRMAQNHPTYNVSILADGNRYSSIDLRGSLQNENGNGQLSFNSNQLKSVELAGCDQLKTIYLGWNGMASDTIDKILQEVDEFGTYNGTLDLVGNGMASDVGILHKDNLKERGWTVYLPGPRITVWSDDEEIAYKDSTPSTSDNTAFGSCNIGESVNHVFSIINTGQYSLHLDRTPIIAIEGDNASDFTVMTQPSATVNPWWGSSSFQITFSPKEPGLREAMVSIINDGVNDKNPFTFSLQGTGNTQISDTILNSGSVSCFGSETILTVAGDDTEVLFVSGASVNLIATQSVYFLPGFHAFPGSYTHAWISTDGTFCDEEPSSSPVLKNGDEILLPDLNNKSCDKQGIKVYPNPNRGIFLLQIENIQFPVEVSLINSNGMRVYKTTISGGNGASFNLPQLLKGLYFVMVNNGKTMITKKIVVE